MWNVESTVSLLPVPPQRPRNEVVPCFSLHSGIDRGILPFRHLSIFHDHVAFYFRFLLYYFSFPTDIFFILKITSRPSTYCLCFKKFSFRFSPKGKGRKKKLKNKLQNATDSFSLLPLFFFFSPVGNKKFFIKKKSFH